MIAAREYIDEGLFITSSEVERRDHILGKLPSHVIDVHAHAGLEEHVGEIDPRTMQHMMSTFPFFTLQDSARMTALFFPGKKVHTVRFAIPWKGINHRAANTYLVNNNPRGDKVALYGIPDDVHYSVEQLRTGRYCGLKMYIRYFEPPVTRIYDFFRPEILEEAQALDVPIILHLPLMITRCIEDLERCLHDFPGLRVVLAHLGLPHLPVPGLKEAYDKFSAFANVFMDTSMIPSPEVVSMALTAFGSDRIMYGSDQPLNLMRQVVYDHPTKGQRVVTTRRYHWSNPEEHAQYAHLAEGAVHSHWQCLEALLEGIRIAYPSTQAEASRNIFYANAREVFDF